MVSSDRSTRPLRARQQAVDRPWGISMLCILLFMGALAMIVLGGVLLSSYEETRELVLAGISLALGLFLIATGLGLWRMKKWGVVLFAVLMLLGAGNNLLRQWPDLLSADVMRSLTGAIGIIGTLLVSVGWLALVTMLWQKTEA